jgi:hypothetical protein
MKYSRKSQIITRKILRSIILKSMTFNVTLKGSNKLIKLSQKIGRLRRISQWLVMIGTS